MQLGFLIVFSVGGFLLLGYWLDHKFGFSPLFIVLGIWLGIAVTVYETYKMVTPLIIRPKDTIDSATSS
ncbi:AtpZ/AtpI family protein [Candidatus Kaiserbacteria bacterium]|nr:AtpZ/AtpI family protein [Candidatus Kaiserbacteria bacterium]